MLTAFTMLTLLAAPRPPRELYDYLRRPEPHFSWKVVGTTARRTEIQLTSQTWHGLDWKHTVLLQSPAHPGARHIGVLYITGDGPRQGDLLDLALFTQAAGLPVAMLFDVPNQPIDGRREDDLIAHTFEEYLKRPDPTEPLLFPMTKSAIKAMDALQEATRHTSDPLTSFVVVGASKRGWTTWFVGASGDPRVRGIAPMVIDNLNIPQQMRHQIESWGKYSEAISDYTRRGLQAELESPRGHDLGVIVDPYSYRAAIRAPTLIVKGANDPYWTADALDNYWPALTEPKWILTVPNAGHTLGNGVMAAETIGMFARSVAGEFPMPALRWSHRFMRDAVQVGMVSRRQPMQRMILWAASSDSLDFRSSTYRQIGAAEGPNHRLSLRGPLDTAKNWAVFCEAQFKVKGQGFSLSTPTWIERKLR